MNFLRRIKCVVWDLDNVIWKGVLLEDVNVNLNENIVTVIKDLDKRGILQSIASKNHHETAIEKLKELGLDEYFLYPQINWNAKSSSISNIVKLLNIGVDSIAFIDDEAFERDEVNHSIPEVLCIDSRNIDKFLKEYILDNNFVTEDSQRRRRMYMDEINRKKAEEIYEGPKEEFLKSLNMELKISSAKNGDLERMEELTIRSHQLNSTGYTYSYEELEEMRISNRYKLITASLNDNYGDFGKIGLAVIEVEENTWTIKLLLMSCRVMSKGIGNVMINHIIRLAQKNNARLRAEFVFNDRNRMMYVTYKFAEFEEVHYEDNYAILENKSKTEPKFPEYLKVIIEE